MKLSNILACIALLVAGAIAGFTYSNARAKAAAEKALAEWTLERTELQKINDTLAQETKTILALNDALEVQNQALEEERSVLTVKLGSANADLAALRANEPVQPELEGQPLVINLRLQIAKGDERYSLAVEALKKAEQEIANQKVQIKGLEQAYHNALLMFNNDEQFIGTAGDKIARLSAQNATIKKVAKVEAVIIVVLTVITLVK